jgi:hypothetical protein
MSPVACNSAIAYVDGDKSDPLCRGYPTDNLAGIANLLESCCCKMTDQIALWPTLRTLQDDRIFVPGDCAGLAR